MKTSILFALSLLILSQAAHAVQPVTGWKFESGNIIIFDPDKDPYEKPVTLVGPDGETVTLVAPTSIPDEEPCPVVPIKGDPSQDPTQAPICAPIKGQPYDPAQQPDQSPIVVPPKSPKAPY